eukprot:gene21035-42371_t
MQARTLWETNLFRGAFDAGMFTRGAAPSERVKYGVLNLAGSLRGAPGATKSGPGDAGAVTVPALGATHYGDSFLQLMPSVRARSTFTAMDSCNQQGKIPVGVAEHYAHFEMMIDLAARGGARRADAGAGWEKSWPKGTAGLYKEVQLHGDIDLTRAEAYM